MSGRMPGKGGKGGGAKPTRKGKVRLSPRWLPATPVAQAFAIQPRQVKAA